MPSRNPDDLNPTVKSAMIKLCGLAAENGITVKVICTHRSDEEQQLRYEQGRTRPGAKVTNAKAGQSPHNVIKDGRPAALAFDVMLYVGKRIVRTATPSDLAIWNKVGGMAADFGLKWGGNFTGNFKDYAHIEIINWRNYAKKY